jgi:DNA (cytosine-5)-methyltransferase 1
MKILDTFAGIGGFSYAAEKLIGGFETTQFIEIDPFCQKVLKKHWPHVPIHDDIRTFTAKPGEYQVITGGFPCQDISVAGLQKGITKETRSGLFYELIRVICMVRPKFVVMENVAAILNRGLDIVLRELSEAGYDAEWSVISASALGACHQRARWWLVAYPNDYGSPSAEKCGFNGETSDRTQEGQNQTGQSAGSSESRNSEVVQRPTELTDTNGKRSQRRLLQFNKELQETRHIRQKDTFSSPNTYSTRTQSDRTRQTESVWTNAFLNSKERRTLSPDWRRYVSEPSLCRGNDGLRGRMDRLRSLGNSVVPQCAAIPLQRVKDLYATTS